MGKSRSGSISERPYGLQRLRSPGEPQTSGLVESRREGSTGQTKVERDQTIPQNEQVDERTKI